MEGQPGFFDLWDRYEAQSTAGDPLERLAAVDFEVFRGPLVAALWRGPRAKGGRPLLRRDEEPCGRRGDGLFEVLGETAIAVQPSQCALDNPAPGQEFEDLGGIGLIDDLDGPFADASQRVAEFVTGNSGAVQRPE